jgi:plasmid stabilization system protein ParE
MSGYTLHPEAFNDLDEIRSYIAEDNPDAADRVVTEIFRKIRGLVRFPHQGYCRPKLSSRPSCASSWCANT